MRVQATMRWIVAMSQVVVILLAAGALGLAIDGVGGKNPAATPLVQDVSILVLSALLFTAGIHLSPPERRRGVVASIALIVVVGAGLVAIILPVLAGAQGVSKKSGCISSIKQIVLAGLMYAGDHDDRMPLRHNWHDQLPRRERSLRCPEDEEGWSYALNVALAGYDLTKLASPSETIAFFEAEASLPNASGGPEWFFLRHNGGGSRTYADGHARGGPPRPGENWSP